MTIVGYPSSDFPPPPTFTLHIPDSWQATWPRGALLAVHGTPTDGVTPNVVVVHHRLAASESFDDVVAAALEQLRRATPTGDLDPPLRLRIEGVENAALLAASFTTDAHIGMLQRQILLEFDSIGPGTALLEITATFGTSGLAEMQTVLDSFEFVPASEGSQPHVLS